MLQVLDCVLKDGFGLVEGFDVDEVLIVQIHVLQSVHDLGHFLLLVRLLLSSSVCRLLGWCVAGFVGLVCLLGFLLSCHFN